MRVSIIAAMSKNRVIGKNGKIPWHLSADLKRFKELTLGHPVIMGRRTFESLGSRPLPGRANIVVTTTVESIQNCIVASSFTEALEIAFQAKTEEIFIIGGAEIYKLALPVADKIYLTLIYAKFEGDAFFPEIKHGEWHKIQGNLFSPTSEFPYSYSFSIFKRIKKAPVIDRG